MARLFIGIPLPDSTKKEIARVKESNKEIKGVRWVPPSNYHITIYYFGEVEEEMRENLLEVIRNGFMEFTAFRLAFDRFEWAPKGETPRMLWGRWEQHSVFLQLVKRTHFLYTQLDSTYSYRKRPIPHVTIARFGKNIHTQNFSLTGAKEPEELYVKEIVLWESLYEEEGNTRYEEMCRVSLAREDL